MKRTALAAMLALLVAAPADAQGSRGKSDAGPPRRVYANPSAGIKADLELSRMTGDRRGRWFALRQTAAPDAVMFAPRMVLAQTWLRNRSDPAPPLRLRPHRAWASCDGSLIVTSGARRDGDTPGWYTTIWQRQPDGAWRWIFTHDGPVADPLPEPDMAEARVAQCPAGRSSAPAPAAAKSPPSARKRQPPPAVPFDPGSRGGRSRDGSLTWHVTVDDAGARRFSARLLVDGEMQVIRDESVIPGGE